MPTTSITPERDERNRLLIARTFPWVPSSEREMLVNHGTPDERAAFVQRQNKWMLAALAVVLLAFFVPRLFRSDKPSPVFQPLSVDQGTIQAIELHETALSTSTTVRTSSGVFQVGGAVSASVGDMAALQTETDPAVGGRKSLCIKSSIKNDCYRLR